MTSGKGPILESDMPFVNSTTRINLSEIQGKTTQVQLEEYIIFPPIYKEKNGNTITYTNGQTDENRVVYTSSQVANVRNSIKNHIMQYGAVGGMTCVGQTQFFSNQANLYNSVAYNCDESSARADHAVSIIGWDDNYPASNFNPEHRPSSNGAWLIQNSYGAIRQDSQGNEYTVFDNGLLYISYEDLLIERAIFGILKMSNVDYTNIYQYDELGANGVLPLTTTKAYAANVFTKNSSTEYITEIGLYLNESDDYTYDIYVNKEDGQIDLNKLQKVKTITNTNASYTTVKLDTPIKITGDKFVIAVAYSGGTSTNDVPIECRISGGDAWYTASNNAGESYISADGVNWYDAKSLETQINGVSNINTCIKAFTVNNLNTILTSSNYKISNHVIKNVPLNTDVYTFKNNITSNKMIKVYTAEGIEVTSSQPIATGMKLKVLETNETYDISVKADINGDGKASVADLLLLKRIIIGLLPVQSPYTDAADLNDENGITVSDLLLIKRLLCGLISL